MESSGFSDSKIFLFNLFISVIYFIQDELDSNCNEIEEKTL